MRLLLALAGPVFAALAYQAASWEVLLAFACAAPLAMLFATRPVGDKSIRRDTATGLLDKGSLIRLMDESMLTEPLHRKTACIAIAIDNFQELQRDWDVAANDLALFQTVERIRTILRTDDIFARLNETELVVFINSLRAPETSAVLALCDRLNEVTTPPVKVDGHSLHLTLSIGFCLNIRAPAQTGHGLLEAAQAALQEARQNAPGAIRSYSKRTRATVENELSNQALKALREGQIYPWYQPQVSTDTGEVTGFEALARWDHPDRGILKPEEFVHLFEDANRTDELGETILNHSLKALVSWDQAGVQVPSISVNFATQELRNPSLVERIKWDVERYGLDPSRLTVEILETVIANNEDDIITRNIRALGTQGFRIDLDDFGTGHASLSNIKRFAVDRIKIDRSFVAHADTDPEQQRMIAAIISLSERLGVETLAEGIETLGERSLLAQLGCIHLQGFAVARPMPFAETVEWIGKYNAKLVRPKILK